MGTNYNEPEKLFAAIIELHDKFLRNTARYPNKIYLQDYQVRLLKTWFPGCVGINGDGSEWIAGMRIHRVMEGTHKITVCWGECHELRS